MEMMGSPPNWQPIEALPIVAQLIADGLDNAAEHLATLGEARPGSLDDATVARIERVFGDEAACVGIYEQQLARWQKEPLAAAHAAEVAALVGQVAKLRSLVASILTRVASLKTSTVERIVRADDAALGLAIAMAGRTSSGE